MKIGSINVKVSIVTIGVVGFFTIFLIVSYFLSAPEYQRLILLWGIPSLILLFVLPMALTYMSQKQYQELEPMYRNEAKTLRVRMINESMIGQIVRIEGVVERVYFQFLNRPQYLVADRTGEISVKMFTSPEVPVNKDEVVEVLGQVIKRYIVTGDPVINCVSIKKIDKKMEAKKKE
jgi:DNA replicative helicase MCM subunit Mcm2 (Cdc46/Mcm family)